VSLTGPADAGSDLRVTYLILAHTAPAQLLRLATVLRRESPDCSVVIHWDPSGPSLDRSAFAQLERVSFVPDPVVGEWGSYSLVEATLRGLRQAVSTGCEWLVLLSGHDYPIMPLPAIEGALHATGADALLDIRGLVSARRSRWWEGSYSAWLGRRYFYRYRPLPLSDRRWLQHAIFRRAAFALSRSQPLVTLWPMPAGARWRVGVACRRVPFSSDVPCVFGSQWMSISRRAMNQVLERVERDTRLVDHFRHSLIPDEAMLHTIINSEGGLRIADGNRRFMRWSDDLASHPLALTTSDIEAMLESGDHFARKLVDAEVLDELDRRREAPTRARS
jgi:hypothetical protein